MIAPVPPRWRLWKRYDTTVTTIFFMAVFASACLIPVQSDTWWHLRAGEEMWTRHAVLLADQFSFVARGAYWPNHEWLSEILFFGMYRAGGLPALTLLAAVLITIAIALSWRLMTGPATAKLLLMAIAMPSIVLVWTVRPHVFTLVLVMTVLHLAIRKIYWPLPILFALWANLHGGVALGLVVLGGVTIAEVWTEGRARLLTLVPLTAACSAATLLTPLGIDLWRTIPESIQKSMANGIAEWRAPILFGWRDLAFWVVALLLLVAAAGRRLAMRTREDAALLVVALALFPLALRYSRNITPFLLVAVPALSRALAGTRLTSGDARRAGRPAVNAVLIAMCAVACAGVIAIAWGRPIAHLQWQPVSPQIIEAVRACPRPLYNRFDDGGYLIWFAKDVPVFVDNRQDPYPLWFLQEHLHREQSGAFEDVFARYHIGCAFLPPSSPTAQRLLQSGWRRTAGDTDWIVLQMPAAPAARTAPAATSRSDEAQR